MKFNLPINNFSSGEWSPKMQSRADTEQYSKSCSEITNMFVQMQGGALYRGGTSYVNFALPLTTNTTDNFLMIPFVEGQYKSLILISRDSGNTSVELKHIGTSLTFTNLAAINGWLPREIQWTQVGSLLFLVSTVGAGKPIVFYVKRFIGGTREFRMEAITEGYVTSKPYKTIPWGPMQALDSSVTLTHSGATAVGGSCTITASSSIFTSTYVGSYIRLCSGTSAAGVLKVTGYTSNTVVTGTVIETIPVVGAYGNTANPTTFWQMSAWSDYKGWPRTVTAYQQRLIFGGIDSDPATLYGSRIGNLFDFEEVPSPSTTGIYGFASSSFLSDNSRPFTLTPASSQASKIVALSSGKSLTIHTDVDEIVAYGTNGALGPNNVAFDTSTSYGAESVMPVRVNNYNTYVQAGGDRVRDIIYNFSEDQYKANDLSFVASHLFRHEETTDTGVDSSVYPVDKIIQLVRYEKDSSYLISHTKSGRINYVTLDRDYQVNAWGRLVIGNNYGTTAYVPDEYPYRNQAYVMAVAALEDDLYFAVYREFQSGAVISIEKLNPPWDAKLVKDFSPGIAPPIYLDGSKTLTYASPTLSFTFGSTWANESVSVVADGAYLGEFTLGASGELTTTKNYYSCTVGFKYPGYLIPSSPQVGGQVGTPLGRIKRIDEVAIKFVNTQNAQVGTDKSNMETIAFRKTSDTMGLATEYYTEEKIVNMSLGYGREQKIIISQDKPAPMYVANATLRGVTYD